MLMKTLITIALLSVALMSNGAEPAAAHGLARQDPGLISSLNKIRPAMFGWRNWSGTARGVSSNVSIVGDGSSQS